MWIAPSYPRSIAIGQVVRLIHAPWNPKLVTAEVRRDPMSGDFRNIRMVGRKLLMGSRGGVSEWGQSQKANEGTAAPLIAKSRFKMFFAGTSPRYIDAAHGVFSVLLGGSAKLV
jgi:hypothetical protein